MTILDKFVRSAAFVPTSVNEYFALQLARILKDESNLSFYLQVCDHFSQDHVLNVYRQVTTDSAVSAAEQFRSSIIN
jgi:hypothetical protein